MKYTRLPPVLFSVLLAALSLISCSRSLPKPDVQEFQFSCLTPAGDACENHYETPNQDCAPADEKMVEKCPESYQGNQAKGVCVVELNAEISLEWVPYSVPPAIDPVGECENILSGVWADTYNP